MRYIWDYTNEYLKENKIGFGLKGLFVRKTLHEIRVWDKVSSYRVDGWVANSSNVRERIKKYYGQDSTVIYPPVPVENIEFNENIPDDYYVIVSRLEPYKKIELAVQAFNQLKKPLVIIGTGSEEKHLKKIANGNIEFLGWQSEKAVYEYMRNAKALIFPGEEDAGITPIESMATGRPVIAYKKGGVRESVIEAKTGVFFDEPTVESLVEAISNFENKIQEFSPKVCRENALKFSEEHFKEQFLGTLKNKYDKYLNEINK
jgi:glycosyltransferase involved in cell wall biosynthesis